jgi:ankyrin repeat protein
MTSLTDLIRRIWWFIRRTIEGPRRMRQFTRVIEADNLQVIEVARSWVQPWNVSMLIALYWEREAWPPKRALVEVLQDQIHPDLPKMMLDFLRAPVAPGDERTELAQAIALGFIDERYDRFMTYYHDRQLLARDVAAVLRDHNLEAEPPPAAPTLPPPPPRPPVELDRPPNQRLLDAATEGDLVAVQRALADDADVDAAIEGGDYDGCSALIMALMRRRFDVAAYLIEQGADVNYKRPARHTPDRTRGQTPLWWAANHGHLALARMLLERGADVNTPDHHGGTPLTQAASSGHLEMVRYLVKMGADVHAQIYDGRKAYNLAITHGRTQVAEYLLGLTMEPDEAGSSGHTPLMIAAENNYYDLAQLLIEQGADVNAVHPGPGSYVGVRGWTPLVFAVRNGFVRMTQLLIEAGADVRYQVPAGQNWRGDRVPARRVIDFAQGKRAERLKQLLQDAGAIQEG